MWNTQHRRIGVYVVTLICLLSACNSTPQTSEPRFVTTPVVGTPIFLNPTEAPAQSSAYPAPGNDQQQQESAYPGPDITADAQAYPAPQEAPAFTDGRKESALESLKYVQDIAKTEFNPDAVLYAIQPSTLMIGNLGNPPVLPGWFYKFKVDGQRREYIIQVVDGTVTGATQAEAAMDIVPPEMPIDVSQLKLDSTQVKEQFDTVAPEKGWDTDKIYDYELVNIQGKGPIWSVIDPMTSQWLYSVSALNGNVVPNPHTN